MENNPTDKPRRTRKPPEIPIPTHHHSTRKHRPKGWNRKCLICGRDPWPNYFYCYDHHPIISRRAQGMLLTAHINLSWHRG